MTGQRFVVVGIGASAGGIEALEGFFRGIPERPGAAFIVVTHLPPERESVLHDIIARYTSLPVSVASEGTRIERDHVYVMPSGGVLRVQNGRLELRKRPEGMRGFKPVDILLASLGADLGEYAVSVVLSGADGDGTLGSKAVKEAGGLTLAQTADGSRPRHPEMPDTAIASGFIDFGLSVEKMGERICEYANEVAKAGAEEEHAQEPLPEDLRQQVCTLLRNQVGHDFSGYKPKTFARRVQRRIHMAQLADAASYVERLRTDPKEVQALFRDLLIGVTNFFRDAEAFDCLKEQVIPKLFEGRKADDVVRVWVPGCATGEEVYSLAIQMREHMAGLTAVPRVQIFATDIDEHALMIARAARYPEELLSGVTGDRRRFFIADGGSYVATKDIRELCIFSSHNVIRDPPFSRIDLISCRNLLIYFGSQIQEQVIPVFHYSLRPGGYLFLGTSENVSQFTDLFTPVDKRHRIFRSREDATASHFKLPFDPRTRRQEDWPLRDRNKPATALREAVEAQVLDRIAPPHVVINQDGEIIYYSGKTGKYLEAPQGAPTRQLLSVARRTLRLDLRTAIRDCLKSGAKASRQHIRVDGDEGRMQLVTISVEQIPEPSGKPLLLIAFLDEGRSMSSEEAQNRPSNLSDDAAQIERELRETRERLQSQIEEYETALEELRSSNEELVSLNEEAQSTNEELEASKEELQSLNEELHTVNTELTIKVDALDRANSDLRNLFESTQIAAIFLDRELVIRMFTPGVSRIFNILPGDRGRPLTDLTSRFELPDLASDVKSSAASGETIERRVRDRDGADILIRFNPYRNSDGDLEGAVVTFLDLSGGNGTDAAATRAAADVKS